MLFDFNEIKASIKSWIDDEVDHTMLLFKKDPLIPILEQQGERFMITEENPTAEHIAKMIFDRVLAAGYPVSKVEVAETDSCIASYSQN
jgi:6-pyruvoyltetrahydropterin/6-carboxytetrahydropterin synthase